MEHWSAHHLFQQSAPALGEPAATSLRVYALRLHRAGLPVIFTLRHLAEITGVSYPLVRATVERRREAANYRMFAIRKRAGGRRHIHAVTGELFQLQQFLNKELLQKLIPHPASFAFHADGGIHACASMHCGARWIFNFDINNFFYVINEVDIYRVFVAAGYRPLLAFEMARLCTTTRLPKHLRGLLWRHRNSGSRKMYKFYIDRSRAVGVLPQGAPTSPMLGNLAARSLDEKLTSYADSRGFIYTRYADDVAISASSCPSGNSK